MQTALATPPPIVPEQSSEAIIQVHNVNKHFGKTGASVRDLNFEVRRGEIFCLLGPSGSGKSTTLRMLTGVYQPSDGEIKVLGFSPARFTNKTRAQIGYLPQQFVLFPELTALENLNFVASIYGMGWFGRRKKVRAVLEFVDLWAARNRLASQLSGGMQRRLELATVLVHDPDLIFADEPTAGIDPVLRAKFWEQFKLLREQGRTLFVTTQYVTEADYCDTVAILNRGRLIALGTPTDIRHLAMGGEIINLVLPEVTGEALRLLRSLPEMRRIQFLSTENLRLTVHNASEALQEIVAAFQQRNLEMESIEPYHPDFEEVFVRLLEQDHEPEQEAGTVSGHPRPRSAGTEDERRASLNPLAPPLAARPLPTSFQVSNPPGVSTGPGRATSMAPNSQSRSSQSSSQLGSEPPSLTAAADSFAQLVEDSRSALGAVVTQEGTHPHLTVRADEATKPVETGPIVESMPQINVPQTKEQGS